MASEGEALMSLHPHALLAVHMPLLRLLSQQRAVFPLSCSLHWYAMRMWASCYIGVA
jgi:hypothetical protein